MLNEAEGRAIREHAARRERVEAERERDKERLLEPFRARHLREWSSRNNDVRYTFEGVCRLMEMADRVWPDPEIRAGAVAAFAMVREALAKLDGARPRLNPPHDTARELVEWIDEKLRQPTSEIDLKIAYHLACWRVEEFATLAPSLAFKYPRWEDPTEGLRCIRRLFASLIADALTASETTTTHELDGPLKQRHAQYPKPEGKRRLSNKDRDEWIYGRYTHIPTADLRIELRDEHPEWECPETDQAICNAVREYAKRFNLPPVTGSHKNQRTKRKRAD